MNSNNVGMIVTIVIVVIFLIYASFKFYETYMKKGAFAHFEEEIKCISVHLRSLIESMPDNSKDTTILKESKESIKELVNAEKKYGLGKRNIAEMVRYLSEILWILTEFRDNVEELLVKSSSEDTDVWEQTWYDSVKLEKVIVDLVNRIIKSEQGRILVQDTIASLAIYRKQLNIRLIEKKDKREKIITDMIRVLDKINCGEALGKEDLLRSGKNFLSLNLFEVYNMFELLEAAAIADQGLVLMAFNVTGETIEVATRDRLEELYMYSYKDMSLYKDSFTDKKFNSLKKFTKFLKAKSKSDYMKDAAILMVEYWEDVKKRK